jgi:hypothetical protein
MAQRLAGIYSLEALRRESPETAGVVVEVLASFVRQEAEWGQERGRPQPASAEVQAALAALGRQPRTDWVDRPLDLHGIALRQAYLPLVQFQRAFLYDCDLESALLVGARLDGCWFARTNLHNANLDEAHLEGADLSQARNLLPKQLASAYTNEKTRLPFSFTPVKRRPRRGLG